MSTVYNLVCMDCGDVISPIEKSPLWWFAKQQAERNPKRLDAPGITGKQCGCIKPKQNPDAPFRVFGYGMELNNYDIPFSSFTQAVKQFKTFAKMGDVVFIDGVSKSVKDRLAFA